MSVGGSVGQVNPSTGAFLWQTGLPCAVMGTPTLDSAGVLAVGTYRCVKPAAPGAYLINAATGARMIVRGIGRSYRFWPGGFGWLNGGRSTPRERRLCFSLADIAEANGARHLLPPRSVTQIS